MKKIIKILPIVLVVFFASIGYVSASSFFFSTNKISINEGETFKVVLSINPGDSKIYTVKADIAYPADMLEIMSFNFSDNWIPISAKEYNIIDNDSGVLIKTAGIPGGIFKKADFGTIVFRAKKKGRAVINVKSPSFSLDFKNNSTLVKNPKIRVVVKSKKNDKEFDIPTELPAKYVFKTSLKIRDKSVDVAYLQLCLKSKGFYLKQITGLFDNSTKRAVKKFQEKYKEEILSPVGLKRGNGIVGQGTLAKLNNVCYEEESAIVKNERPKHLFDIHLELDSSLINHLDELVARVVLDNFGKEPTPIRLDFSIVNSRGKKVFNKRDFIVVETEKVFTKKFPDIDLASGRYDVVLDTLYNTDVKDEFRSSFTIAGPIERESVVLNYWGWIGIGLSISIGIAYLLIELFRYFNREKKKGVGIKEALKKIKDKIKDKIKKK